MRKDQVITGRKVRVKTMSDDSTVAKRLQGRVGTIRPSTRSTEVPVEFEDEPNTTYYFRPEMLEDISNAPAETGDTILIRAKVIERDLDLIKIKVEGENPQTWIPRDTVHTVVDRAPWYPPEPMVGTIALGHRSG